MSYEMPVVAIGDQVLFYDNPQSPQDPCMGWIHTRPGKESVSILIYAPNTGFVEKQSVRHRLDPFWQTSETAQAWSKWGCWELHPNAVALQDLKATLTRVKIDQAKKDK